MYEGITSAFSVVEVACVGMNTRYCTVYTTKLFTCYYPRQGRSLDVIGFAGGHSLRDFYIVPVNSNQSVSTQ